MPKPVATSRFQSFAEFYPYYLSEHEHPVCRALHYSGSLCALASGVITIIATKGWLLPFSLLAGYSQA